MRQPEIEGRDRKAVAFTLHHKLASWPCALQQFSPAEGRKAPKIIGIFDTNNARSAGKDYPAGPHDPEGVPEAKVEFAKKRKRAWEQNTIVSFRLKNVLGVGEIASESCVGLWLNVETMNRAEVVAESAAVNVAIDLENVASNFGTVPLEKPIDVISINWSAALQSKVVGEGLQPA